MKIFGEQDLPVVEMWVFPLKKKAILGQKGPFWVILDIFGPIVDIVDIAAT